MATVDDPSAGVRTTRPAPQPRRRPVGRWLSDHLVLFIGILVLVYTFVPIGYIIALSFNQPSGRSATAQFESFTWNNWTTICEPDGLCDSLKLSIAVSITATILATVLGHADGVRAGAALLPRPGGVEPGDLPADGDARGRDGVVAAGDVRVARVRQRRSASPPS